MLETWKVERPSSSNMLITITSLRWLRQASIDAWHVDVWRQGYLAGMYFGLWVIASANRAGGDAPKGRVANRSHRFNAVKNAVACQTVMMMGTDEP